MNQNSRRRSSKSAGKALRTRKPTLGRSDRSLQKIQPRGTRKVRNRSAFSNPLAKVGAVFGALFLFFLIFIFEFPANNPDKFSISSAKVDASAISLKVETDSYKGKLVPLEFLLAIGGGEITVVGEKDQTIVFADGDKLILKMGSAKMKLNGKNIRLNAPVVQYQDIVLVPGELLTKLFPDKAAFKDGTATVKLAGAAPAGDYTPFTGAEGYQRLVNKENPLDAAYAPEDLVGVNSYGSIAAYGSNTKLRKEAAEALVKMYGASGKNFVMSSGYRDYQTQTDLFNKEVSDNIAAGMSEATAKAQASTLVAVPGTSEHQLGLAVDFGILGQSLGQDFANTEAGKWLAQNSYKYGFVLRYTEAQAAVTNIVYEPWHFRYIGYPHSEILVKDKIVLDTYITMLREEKMRIYKAEDGMTYAIWLLSGDLKPKDLQYKATGGVGVSTDNKDGILLTLPISR